MHIYLIARDVEIAKDCPIVQRLFIEYKGASIIEGDGPKSIYSYIYVMFIAYLKKIEVHKKRKKPEIMKRCCDTLDAYSQSNLKFSSFIREEVNKLVEKEGMTKLVQEGTSWYEDIKNRIEDLAFNKKNIGYNQRLILLMLLANCLQDNKVAEALTGKSKLKKKIKVVVKKLSAIFELEVKLFIVMDKEANFHMYQQIGKVGSITLLVTENNLFVLYSKKKCEREKIRSVKQLSSFVPDWLNEHPDKAEFFLVKSPCSTLADNERVFSSLATLYEGVCKVEGRLSHQVIGAEIKQRLKEIVEENMVPEFKAKMNAAMQKPKIKKERTETKSKIFSVNNNEENEMSVVYMGSPVGSYYENTERTGEGSSMYVPSGKRNKKAKTN
eukprot:TRINITY_DN13244_c0_g1_i1.p1 TRINITY_DN13244_c0_g1~~TRINITY_DN13244_c0_g1_i1.p1  ORF type:complete len:383 (+),score=93.21 TRINITY_DN13244_c0_g1_i1:285-1433(+)